MGAQTANRKQRGTSGFTVVELIVTVVLTTGAILSLVSIVQYIQYSQRSSFYVDEANRVARSKIAEFQNKDFNTLIDGDTVFSSDPALSKLPAGRQAKVTVSPSVLSAPGQNKRIDVIIRYPLGATEKIITLTAYVDPPEV